MFIKFNLRLLAETPGNRTTHGACVEVNDRHEEVSSSGKHNDPLFTTSDSEAEAESDEPRDEADQLIRTLVRADAGDSESDTEEEGGACLESSSDMEAVRRTDEETAASLDESSHHHESAAFKLCSNDEEDAKSSGEMRPRSMSQNVLATSPSAHLSSKTRAVQSKPPRRIKRLRVKARQRAVEPVSRPRPRRAEVPSLFGPPRSSRRRQEETASIATDEDVKNFIECYGATMNITTAWQWNSEGKLAAAGGQQLCSTNQDHLVDTEGGAGAESAEECRGRELMSVSVWSCPLSLTSRFVSR